VSARPPLACVALVALLLAPMAARADDAKTHVDFALEGLAPFSTLLETPAGKAVVAGNLYATGGVQNGTLGQPGLMPFAQQQAQALRDATITDANALELTDALGPTLEKAYAHHATCSSPNHGENFDVSCKLDIPSVAALIAYTASLSGADSNVAKFFFANGATTPPPYPPNPAGLMQRVGGTPDIFGRAYLCRTSVDPYGDSRPFQTEPQFTHFLGADYFDVVRSNEDYLCGPVQDLRASPSFPSGHTTYGYTEALVLALLVPERYPQMIVRAAEYGNSRIVVGAHYAMDVIGGRTLALYDVAHLLAEHPAYIGQTFGKLTPVAHYGDALAAARADLQRALAHDCGAPVATCARDDASRFHDAPTDAAFVASTLTYGMPAVYSATTGVENVGTVAPEAGYLLTAAFPRLTLAQSDRILTDTEGPGGGFLDNGSAFGLYSRLDLYRAALTAARL
jgi:hypothetical protein